jgi:Na+/melibiose symporter-like transporter
MESCLTDTIDLDHVRQKRERFGLYFGLWKFSGKASRSMAMLITGSLLDWASVNAPIAETSERLAWIFGPGVGSFFAGGALLLIPYKLTEAKCQQVKSILQRRRK